MPTSRWDVLRRVRNWAAVKKIRADLLVGIRATRGNGHGLDIPLEDKEDPERVPLMVRALEEILIEHPEFEAMQGPENITIGYKQDLAATISPVLREQLERDGFIAKRGDELRMEPLPQREPADPEDLWSREELLKLGYFTDRDRFMETIYWPRYRRRK